MSKYTPSVSSIILCIQNSCGYDAAFAILYSIWSGNSGKWSENFRSLENPYLNTLRAHFEHIHTTGISFEAMHDNFHYFLQASDRQEFKFGQYISIAILFETLCKGLDNI